MHYLSYYKGTNDQLKFILLPFECYFTRVYNLQLILQFCENNCYLKALDTFGNCQRPVFSLDVYQHMHKLPNLCKFLAQLVVEFAR